MVTDLVVECPAEFVPMVTVRDGSSPEQVDLGVRYWAMAGVSGLVGAFGSPSVAWEETTSELGRAVGVSTSRLYLHASVGVEATLEQFVCPTCQAPVLLKSRASVVAALKGEDPTQLCCRCDERFQGLRLQVADPVREEARRERAAKEAARRASEQAERRVAERARQARVDSDRRRRLAFEETYPFELEGEDEPDWDSLRARVRTETGVLALLDHAPSVTPIPPPSRWGTVFGPDPMLTHGVLASAFHAKLLRIHPTESPLETLVWEDGESDVPTGSFYPAKASWYAWQGASMGTSADCLRQRLRDRVEAWLLTEQGVLDVVEMVADLIAAETISYLDSELARLHLPAVAENHVPRLEEAARALASCRSLGECYGIAWRATRAAAAASREHPRAPLENMTTYAVNWFEKNAQPAIADPAYELKMYSESAAHPISDLMRTLMMRVLDVDLMATSPVAVGVLLRSREEFPRPLATVYDVDVDPDSLVATEVGVDVGDEVGSEPPAVEMLGYLSERLADALGLADVVEATEGRSLDLARAEAFLDEPLEQFYEAAGVAPESHADVRRGVGALRVFRRTVGAGLDPGGLARALLGFAYLQPGEVRHPWDGEPSLLGELLGDEIAYRLGLVE